MFASPGSTSARIADASIARSTGAGFSASKQPQHFLGDAFAGKLRDAALFRRRRAQRLGVDLALAVPGMEAEQAQDAQIILADARDGVADEAHAARRCRSAMPPT